MKGFGPRGRASPYKTLFFCFSKEKDRKRKCLQDNIDTCVTNTRLFDDTEKVLQGTLTNERLFCNRTSLDINSLLQNVKPLADCKQQFFDDAETCAKPFRKIFLTSTSAERKTDKTCRCVYYVYGISLCFRCLWMNPIQSWLFLVSGGGGYSLPFLRTRQANDFEAFFNFKVILHFAKIIILMINFKCRDIAPLTNIFYF